jgi:aryl-alcohol dehydrogenase-like predicted oxidoreductase
MPLFDCVQATWNLLEPSAGAALRMAHDQGLGVIVKEALANGRLTERNTDPQFEYQRQTLKRWAERCSTSIDALALAAVLAQPWVDVVLSGAATQSHLQSNLAAHDVHLPPEGWSELSDLAEEANTYWSTRAGLAWN